MGAVFRQSWTGQASDGDRGYGIARGVWQEGYVELGVSGGRPVRPATRLRRDSAERKEPAEEREVGALHR